MKLNGSCHCRRVKFSLESGHAYPYNLCYCSICRKTAGGGGYAINLGGDADSLKIEGEAYLKIYQVEIIDPDTGQSSLSPVTRHFCTHCGSALWVWDPRWPELIHPFASAIDTPLPIPPEHTHLMLGSKANWVEVHAGPQDRKFESYPDESIAQWHKRIQSIINNGI